MQTEITLFGQLAEKAGSEKIRISNVADTETLMRELRMRFPLLADLSMILAVNRRTVTENTPLGPDDEVAIMPPFSGG